MAAKWNQERAKALWLEGLPARQISVRLGVGRVALMRHAAADGWPKRATTSPLTRTDPLLLMESDPASAHRFVVSGPRHLILGLP
jgi:hypothetical protein